MSDFQEDLRCLLNQHSRENQSGTPDFILAQYLLAQLYLFDQTTRDRDLWWGFEPKIGGVISAVDAVLGRLETEAES